MRNKQLTKRGVKMKNKFRTYMTMVLGSVAIFEYYLIKLLSVSDFSGNISFFSNDPIQQEIVANQLITILPYLLITMVIGFVGSIATIKKGRS
tara:strand:- start:641 stop:919 length:279 start_codon:yes stop_codon:yes gene_type:complete